ncbi:MAG: DUF305 domain-containing protein [Gemmatimonadota bacterium]|nr:DUF305 domain-containing protein [Gemmatimonadota bacterium]
MRGSTAMLLVVGGVSCAGNNREASTLPPAPSASGGQLSERGGGPSPVDPNDFERIYQERVTATRIVRSPADVAFMTRMIGHHTQAIEMSRLAPENGANQAVQVMAARIINTQADEIRLMRNWLSARGQPLPEESSAIHQHHDPDMMPGMVTPEQFEQLEAARGEMFDQLFLTLMIQHHSGAVRMVEELFSTDGAAQDEEVFKFASDTLADQGSEVARMKTMLDTLARQRP